MTLEVTRHVPARQIIIVHAPLERVEWPGTIEHIERTKPRSRGPALAVSGCVG